MLRSIQAVAYSMQVQADRLNITANNIANITTNAYKKDVVSVRSFDEVMASAMQYDTGKTIGLLGTVSPGSAIGVRRTFFEQGYLEDTAFDTDFGIRGDGFFVLETPEIQYTRAGNFTFDQDHYLVTQDGSYVLGENGPIQIPSEKIKVNLNGDIFEVGEDMEMTYVDSFRIAYMVNPDLLTKTDSGNYITGAQNVTAEGKSDIMQKHLEKSNVDVVQETQDMMEAKRNFESCQQVIRMLDDTLGKASNEIGRL